jgi:hypothetical protein
MSTEFGSKEITVKFENNKTKIWQGQSGYIEITKKQAISLAKSINTKYKVKEK